MNKKPTSDKPLALSNLPIGAEAYVTDLIGGRSFRSKVLGLGLNIGAKIRIDKTTSSTNGCMIITINNSRLAIGHGMAKKIIVSQSFVKN